MKAKTSSLLLLAPVAVVIGVLAQIGCDIPKRPSLESVDVSALPTIAPTTSAPAASTEIDSETLEEPGQRFSGRWETWDAYFIDGDQVGYSHVVAEAAESDPLSDVRFKLDSQLQVNQGDSLVLQQIRQTSMETYNEHLIGFVGVVHSGPAFTRYEGDIDDGFLHVNEIRGETSTRRTVPWHFTYRGLVALEQSLRQRPMLQKGETRTLRMLVPGRYQLATARLSCAGEAIVPTMEGSMEKLIEINSEVEFEDGRSNAAIWTDAEGNIVRTFSPGRNLITYRTDEATATSFRDGGALASMVFENTGKVSTDAKRVYLVITPLNSRLDELLDIHPQPGQFIRFRSDGTIEVLVIRDQSPTPKGFNASDLVPSQEDLTPNSVIDSNQSLVRRIAVVASASKQVDQVALDLTKTVQQTIRARGEPSVFAAASKTVVEEQGDATDQAILLTALLRARGIPARLALGLKVSHPDQQLAQGRPLESNLLAYHAWTIAHVNGEWIHLDASEGGPAAADRLIFSTTTLAGSDEQETLKSLLRLMGKIKIEIVKSI